MQYPDLNKLKGGCMRDEDDEDGINLECIDPVTIKFEGSTAMGMRGTIVIKKMAIKDRKFLQWI